MRGSEPRFIGRYGPKLATLEFRERQSMDRAYVASRNASGCVRRRALDSMVNAIQYSRDSDTHDVCCSGARIDRLFDGKINFALLRTA